MWVSIFNLFSSLIMAIEFIPFLHFHIFKSDYIPPFSVCTAVRADPQGKTQYRIYCAVHSKGQKEKDARLAAARVEDEIRAANAAHNKAAQAQLHGAAIASLDAEEQELNYLRSIRVNMESCRVLADQCKRREKLKRQLAAARPALHAERLQNPLAAVQFLDKLHELEEQGMPIPQQLEVLPALAAAAAAVLQPPPPPPPPPAATPGAPMAVGAVTADGGDTSGGGRRSARNASKRHRGDGDQYNTVIPLHSVGGTATAATNAQAYSGPIASPVPEGPIPAVSLGKTDNTEERGPAKRTRRGQPLETIPKPTAVVPPPATATATAAVPAAPAPVVPAPVPVPSGEGGAPQPSSKPSRSGGLSIERQRLMSSAEAKEINSRLPLKFKYVPVDQLTQVRGEEHGGAAGASARAARAAARAAGHSPTGPSPAASGGGPFSDGIQTRRSRDPNKN